MALCLQAAGDPPGYQYFRLGQPGIGAATTKPGVALMGGGEDLDAAFRWLCDHAGGGNFVVLRASGDDAYNAYVRGVCPELKAVETLVITSREGASQAFVVETIRRASVVFLSGGSQDHYINWWQGTPIQTEINALIARGRPIGGTSAGLAVLGEYNFSALKDTIQSSEALKNPFDPRVTVGRGFLKIPHLEKTITDSHFVARDRMGRTITFLARMARDGERPQAIAIDEKAAVLMDADGTARVSGKGQAYFLRGPGLPEQCLEGVPLTYRNLEAYRLQPGVGSFDVGQWTGKGGLAYVISAVAGVLESSLGSGRVY